MQGKYFYSSGKGSAHGIISQTGATQVWLSRGLTGSFPNTVSQAGSWVVDETDKASSNEYMQLGNPLELKLARNGKQVYVGKVSLVKHFSVTTKTAELEQVNRNQTKLQSSLKAADLHIQVILLGALDPGTMWPTFAG